MGPLRLILLIFFLMAPVFGQGLTPFNFTRWGGGNWSANHCVKINSFGRLVSAGAGCSSAVPVATTSEELAASISDESGTGALIFGTGPTFLLPRIEDYTIGGTLPAAGTVNRVALVTNGGNSTDCTVGGGSNYVWCVDNGSAWVFPGGGGASWGGIIGTLSNQTDLAMALGLRLLASNNLSDLGSASTARTNLGLGNSATLDTGTTGGTVALGNHTHTGVYEPADSAIQSHIANTSNPHSVTKTQVSLGNVDNFGTASQVEAEAGASSSKFMTPERTAQAIAAIAPATHAHAGEDITSGTVAAARLPATTVYTGQGNTFSTGAQDFGSATSVKVPTSNGAAPTANGLVAYDSTANKYKFGANGSTKTIATEDGNIATATALAANGSNCSAGQYPLGVDASGAAENCTAVSSLTAGTDYVVPWVPTTLSATLAGACGASQTGQHRPTTDSGYSAVCNGSSLQWWWQGYPVTLPPAVSSWTTGNLDACTDDDESGSLYFMCPKDITAEIHTWRIADTPPFTVTALFEGYIRRANYNSFGLAFTDGTKYATCEVLHNSDYLFGAAKWTDTGTYSGADYTITEPEDPISPAKIWLRIVDDGATNRTCSYSLNGTAFATLHTVGRTDFLTPTGYAISLKPQNASYDAGVRLISLSVQ